MLFYDILLCVVIVALIAAPILTVAFFISSLKRYLFARNANKECPGAFSDEELRERRSGLIITSVLVGLFVVIIFMLNLINVLQDVRIDLQLR